MTTQLAGLPLKVNLQPSTLNKRGSVSKEIVPQY